MASSVIGFSGIPSMSGKVPRDSGMNPNKCGIVIHRRSFAKLGVGLLAAQFCHPVIEAAHATTDNTAAMVEKVEKGKKSFADIMETGMKVYEQNIAERKRKLFSKIESSDTVADIGIGTGPNLPYMPKGTHVIGVDPNKYMRPYAEKRASNFQVDLRFKDGVCENIPLADESCDVVLTTLTLCSVKDSSAAIKEVLRVLKPGGYHIFIEHVIAPPKRPILRAMQNLLDPLQVKVCDGCHLNRETADVIRHASNPGYSEIEYDTFDARFGGFADSFNPLRPHIAGYARKAQT